MLKDSKEDARQNPALALYLINARNWYFGKYLRPYTDFTYFLTIALVLLFSALQVIRIVNEESEGIEMPFCVYNDNISQVYYSIRPLKGETTNINIPIARYLAEYYVKLRESFPLDMVNDNYLKMIKQRIAGISSLKVASQYNSYINIKNNKDSPLNELYNFQKYRKVRAFSAREKMISNNKKPTCIIVPFELIEQQPNHEAESKFKIAVMHVKFNDIAMTYSKKLPLDFLITDYFVYDANSKEAFAFDSCNIQGNE